MFTLQKIAELASSRQVFLRGVRGYDADWVQDYHSGPGVFYPVYTTARVQEGKAAYRVEVGLNQRGQAEHFTCDCPSFHPKEGACKHIVAVLTHKYYTDMVETAPKTTAAPAASLADPRAQQLIDQYMSRGALHLAVQALPREELVTLRPILRLTGGSPVVSFTLGHRRQYVLKSPEKFAHAMAQGSTLEYGKQLRLMHHPEAFTPECRPLVQFLLEELSVSGEAAGLRSAPGLVPGELRMSPGCFDRFFALQSQVWLRRPTGDSPLRLAVGEPTLTVEIRREAGGLRLVGEPVETVTGNKSVYILQGGTLYCPGEVYTQGMAEWLRAMTASLEGLFLKDSMLPAFCAGVLPFVEPYLNITGEREALEPYRPGELQVRVYLDAPRPDTVTGRMVYAYGQRELLPFQQEGEADISRDPLGELRAETVFLQYFPRQQGVEPSALEGDEEEIFAFLTQGLEALRRVATVYATDRFDSLMPAAPPRVQVGLSLQSDLLELTLEAPELSAEELTEILKKYRQGQPYHRLRGGRFLQLEGKRLAELADLAEGLGLTDQELRSGQILLPKYRALYLEQRLRQRSALDMRCPETVKALAERCRQAAASDYPLPTGFQGTLRPYQQQGYRWMRTLENCGFGGILADEMGLGKTVQVIALLLAAAEQGEDKPSLVVCPTSLVHNWAQELRRFAPGLSVLCIQGTAQERQGLLANAANSQVVLTSYDMLKRDVEAYEELTFRYQILDEAQYIKNSGTQNARAVKIIRAAQRFALTGTPMENRLSELWSIFDFLMPGFLFTYGWFRTRFEQPILRQGEQGALERLAQMTAPFILRRLKSQVLTELPKKTQRILPAVMDASQWEIYNQTAGLLRGQLEQSRGKTLSGQNRMTVLATLTRLRQICCDPRLCLEAYTGESCKLEACMELLREATAGGHKVLLFSQFTSMLELLRRRLEAENIAYYLLQGSTPGEERVALAERFNTDDTPVFLISLKAGGTGLNLVGADMVIHYDPWWNFAAQEQATDRAHRIGQKKPVEVVRLIVQDTIEERILRLQEGKQQLADAIIGAGDIVPMALTPEVLLALLH